MSRVHGAVHLALGAAVLLGACAGREVAQAPVPVRPAACGPASTGPQPGDAPLRRLTRFEYDNTVGDLLGDASRPALGFPPEDLSNGFDNQAATVSTTQLLAEDYLEAAEQVAARAVTDLAHLLPCDPGAMGDDACARAFIADFGKRAFRRPLAAEEGRRLYALYASGRERWGFATGIQLVVEAALQSPRFLYRIELGMPEPASPSTPGVVALDPYEIASRLSYLYWASMPDAELFAAADAGELATAEQVGTQAARMLRDPRARAAVGRFHEEWLGLDALDTLAKDPGIYPRYSGSLPPLWKQETLGFVERVIFDDHGGLGEMLTAPWSTMNADLAAFYGVPGPGGEAFAKVDLDPAQRAGLLTQAGILAAYAKPNQSSPVARGLFVRERLLCQTLPAPPPGMAPVPPPVNGHATTAQMFIEHSANPACSVCHELMDGIGLGFEHYDGIGLWRDTDHGLPVDASGNVLSTEDANGPFDGVPQLAARLAASQEVRDCLVTQWFRYAYGRGQTPDDTCTTAELQGAFAASGHSVEGLLVALTQTDAFRYRPTVVAGQ